MSEEIETLRAFLDAFNREPPLPWTRRGSAPACKLDSKPRALCSSPKTYKRVKPGKHRFKVWATDAAGNADTSPAKYAWKVKR